MRTGWVVDLRHFLAPSGALPDMPAPARRPARRPCPGIIYSVPSLEDLEVIDWHCPECGDYGVIRGWEGTLWDGFAYAESRSGGQGES